MANGVVSCVSRACGQRNVVENVQSSTKFSSVKGERAVVQQHEERGTGMDELTSKLDIS